MMLGVGDQVQTVHDGVGFQGIYTAIIDHVLVIGVGLYSLTAAIELSKAGIRFTILERSSELREVRVRPLYLATEIC